MERTQIYLTKRETAALDRAARETGRSRSDLIREAIEARYMTPSDMDATIAALDGSAGIWADREESGQVYVERLRHGRLAKLHQES